MTILTRLAFCLVAVAGVAQASGDELDYGGTCLALVGFSEARNQSDAGLAAVMQVVINRATDPAHRWPQALCDVALQPGQFIGVDNWPTPRRPDRIDALAWQRAQAMAARVIAGTAPVPSACAAATSFDQAPARAANGSVCRLGAHTFYVDPLPARSAIAAAQVP